MNDKICHVTNQVTDEADVEEHVEHSEKLLPCVDSMQVSIPNCGESHDCPIHRIRIPEPNAVFLEIRNLTSDPCIGLGFVVGG